MSVGNDLDPVAIERLRRIGGPTFAAEMIGLFLSYGAEKLSEARGAYQAGDLGGVQNAVHPLRSSAGNVGALRVQQLASETELKAAGHQADAVGLLLDQLEAAFQTVKPLIDLEREP
ncbi:MAG: Hpt domain-containing protein [Verrucomicrobia bacterium]|jgi:HPt (histidine-containing phosphotransfer) domain-containing protein|nr:Hpt domain-containing protein [Verrucomicrobiota bacterium]